ncbi:hypothetical protein GCM10023321_79960 [Pseudonocardia eucalypti]|uniref:Uncharacterized protein n=1 Tax=Pseudonocardia eucalypti TaxID=648755 RepID=A0ABP9RC77_9PSEU|nr:hypothetical protein [Pseudonocardia eucalypti]
MITSTPPRTPQSVNRWSVLRGCVSGTAIDVAVVFLATELYESILDEPFVSGARASAYWVDYRDGFVRRGLPGAFLRLFTDSPTPAQATWFAAGMLVAGAVALLVLVILLARTVSGVEPRLLVVAVAVASPFTFDQLLRIIGRFDGLGFAAMAAIALLCVGGAAHRSARAVGIGALVLLATATEELLFAFVAPIAVIALFRLGRTGHRLRVVGAAVLAPGTAVAALSVLRRPSRDALTRLITEANAAGLEVNLAKENTISTLGQTATQGFRFFLGMSPLTVLTGLIVFGGCYLLTTAMLRTAVGSGRLGALAVGFALVAVLLSAVGNDYRRWWALAFVAFIAALAMLGRPERMPAPSFVHALLACAVLAFSLKLHAEPIFPKWDKTADTGFSVERLHQLDPTW